MCLKIISIYKEENNMPLFITNEIKKIIKKEVLEEIREENNKTIEELNEKFKIISKLLLEMQETINAINKQNVDLLKNCKENFDKAADYINDLRKKNNDLAVKCDKLDKKIELIDKKPIKSLNYQKAYKFKELVSLIELSIMFPNCADIKRATDAVAVDLFRNYPIYVNTRRACVIITNKDREIEIARENKKILEKYESDSRRNNTITYTTKEQKELAKKQMLETQYRNIVNANNITGEMVTNGQ